MLSDNGKISGRQAAWILIMDMIGVGLFGLSDLFAAGNPIVLLTSGLVWVLIWSGVCYLIFLGERYCHSVVKNVLKWLWVIVCVLVLIISLQYFDHVIDTLVPVHYGNPMLLLLIPVLYGAGKGMEVRGRMAELLGWLVIVPLILLLIMGFLEAGDHGSLAELCSLSDNAGIYIHRNEVKIIGLLYLAADNPWKMGAYVGEKDDHPVKFLKRSYSGVIGMIVGNSISLAALWLTGVYLDFEGMRREAHPFGIVLQLIRLPINFISRYDIFYIMLWMVCFAVFLSGVVIRILDMSGMRGWISELIRKYASIVGKNRRK